MRKTDKSARDGQAGLSRATLSHGSPSHGRNLPRLGDVIMQRIDQLAAISDDPNRLTRLYLGPAHKAATEVVASWMRDAGMTTRVDAVGSVVGHYPGPKPDAPVLILGSHIDTVRNAGRFDGNLGVLAAIAVVERLNADAKRLPFAIDVVAFGDEEGVRFPGTLTGSRALAGRFDRRVLDDIDADGQTRQAALAAFGCDVTAIGREARDPARVVGYVELHIEQGPVLETQNRAVAVVTGIAGATRGRVVVTGEAGHAGTVPMALRHDAMTAAAEMILAIERRAVERRDLVATVGTLEINAAAGNVVPGEVRFTIDVRSESDAVRRAAIEAMQQDIQAIADRRGVTATATLHYDAPAAASDPALLEGLAAAIGQVGHEVIHLSSGAGHDAMSFHECIPFAMLFVRSRAGLSHHPDEFTSADDIDVAAQVLLQFINTYRG